MSRLDSLLERLSRRPAAALAMSCVLLAALAWSNRFIQDDAFILFQYARRLVEGHGLTWLDGERVEGYTTFLWTLLLGVPFALHLDPVVFAWCAGLLLYAGTLLSAYSLAVTLTGSRGIALLAVWLLGTNHTFSAFATGGLETVMQALFVTASWALAARMLGEGRFDARRLAGFSLLVAGALLTRLDSALLIALPFARLALRIARRGEGPGPALTSLGALTLPALVLVGGWFAWKVPYYGEWLPNTFFAKTGAAASVRRGLAYVLAFLAAYALWPFAAGALIAWRSVARGIREWIAVAATLALWLLYVVLVGGDFMEFRMFVAILPLVAIVVAWMIAAIRPRIAGAALLLTAIAASAYHARTYEYERETESTRRLNAYVADADQGWILAGRKLGEAFGEARDSMLIATTAAGAIPFESRIPALDMHGLMDRWIARNGFVRASTKPGHRRFATLEYLLERRVNLVIGHPHVRPIGDSVPPFGVSDFVEVGGRSDAIPPDARLVELPLGTGYALTMLELVRSPAVDRLIERRGLRTAAPSTP